ncbi:MAG TPA: hydrogenase maturation nickel metallochaperone HypA [Gemmatimonadaceae bacterium]|jgi:hydrogenase nickel incorporation protein HypA/HybF|nr:hydrogenase maturation nickel metallochaperone HypA [Gemmatimonadaceae bacterium]
MHELSVALSLIDLAQTEADRLGGRISAVHIRLGALSGVVKDALLFSYEVACHDTPLEGSHLVIEEVPLVVYCPTCDADRTLRSTQLLCCAECGTPTPLIREGRELELVALEVES